MMFYQDLGYLGSVSRIFGFIDLCIFVHNFPLFYAPVSDAVIMDDIGRCKWFIIEFGDDGMVIDYLEVLLYIFISVSRCLFIILSRSVQFNYKQAVFSIQYILYQSKFQKFNIFSSFLLFLFFLVYTSFQFLISAQNFILWFHFINMNLTEHHQKLQLKNINQIGNLRSKIAQSITVDDVLSYDDANYRNIQCTLIRFYLKLINWKFLLQINNSSKQIQYKNQQKIAKIMQNAMLEKKQQKLGFQECNISTYKNNKQQNKMIPNQFQQTANDYGFNLSKKYNIAKQPSQTNTQFNIPYQLPNKQNNNYSHNSMHSGNQFSIPRSFQLNENEYERPLIVGNYPEMNRLAFETKQNIVRDLTVMPSPEQSHRAGGSGSQKQGYRRTPIYSQKQLTTVETFPSVQHLLPLNPSIHIQAFNDFLYKFIGIASCHVRVQQRSALRQISQYSKLIKLVRRCTGFCDGVNNIIKNKLQYAIICIKFNTMHESAIRPIGTSHRRIEQQKTKQVTKKVTKIQSLSDSKFNLQESTVQKGLKYLQDRANQRRKKQEQKIQTRNKNIMGSLNHINNQQNQIETGKLMEIRSEKNYTIQNDPYLTKQVANRHNQVNSNTINQINHQFNAYPNKKNNNTRKFTNTIINKNPKNQIKSTSIDEQKVNKQDTKQASWLVVGMKQNPYQPNNKKQNFQRYQANQNKYHLNPDTFKQSEPDINDFVMPIQYNIGEEPSMLSQYGIPKRLAGQNSRANLLQDTLPLFDPSNNQNATRFWEPPVQANKQIDNYIKNNNNTFANPYIQAIDGQSLQTQKPQEKLMDSLPSFNQKGNQFINDKTATFQQVQKQRRKSDLAHYNFTDKEKGSQLRISEQDYEQEIQQMEGQYNFNKKPKRNIITQYYTQKNIGNKDIRASFDFPKSGSKSQRPISRPKSMTYSIGNDSTKETMVKPINMNKLQSKKINPQFKSGRIQLPASTSKPKININYESPNYYQTPTYSIPIASQNYPNIKNVPSYQNVWKAQNRPRVSFYQNAQPQSEFRQQQVYNKPTRAVSSGCKFFYAQPKQSQNMQQSLPPMNFDYGNAQRQQIPINITQYYPPNQRINLQPNLYSNPAFNHYFHQTQIPNHNIPNFSTPNTINSPRNVKHINHYQPQDYSSLQQSQQQQAYNFISSKQIRKGINVYVASDPSLTKYHSEKNLHFSTKRTPVQFPGAGRKIHVTTAEQN